MALRLSKEQEETALRYMGNKMQEEGVNSQNVLDVLRWVINNPNPSIEVMEADVVQQRIDERAAKIEKHRAALVRLEAEV